LLLRKSNFGELLVGLDPARLEQLDCVNQRTVLKKWMLDALRHHWSEYLMEAAGLGIFMISAAVFTFALEYPASPVRHMVLMWAGRRLFRLESSK
jgi:hypothetical protein